MFTPYAGIVYDLNQNLSVYASYSDIFSPQTVTAVGDSILSPEEGRQVEAGIKGQFLDGRVNASMAVFELRDTNRAVEDGAHPGYSVAAGEVRSRGFEAELSGELTPGCDLYAGYSYTHLEYTKDPDLEGQTFDPRQPEHMFKLWSSYNFQNDALAAWTIGGGMRAVSSMKSDSAPEIKQDAFAVFDAQVSSKFNDHVNASLAVNNIFNKYYYERVGWTNWYNQVGAPRSVTFSLRSTF